MIPSRTGQQRPCSMPCYLPYVSKYCDGISNICNISPGRYFIVCTSLLRYLLCSCSRRNCSSCHTLSSGLLFIFPSFWSLLNIFRNMQFRLPSTEILCCEIPINQFIQQGADIVHASVLIIQVAGMFPHVAVRWCIQLSFVVDCLYRTSICSVGDALVKGQICTFL
jgi:hypothetical protein